MGNMNPPKITRAQFLSLIGLSALSLVLFRIETLETTLKAIVPDQKNSTSSAYGRSNYGA